MASQPGNTHVKVSPPRKSEPSKLAPPKATNTRICKSAGNSPASSPQLSRKTIENVSNTSNQSIIDVDGISEIKPNLSETVNFSHTNNSKKLIKCPCSLPPLKNSVPITCSTCQQEWHSTCVNLSGITQAAVKKLTQWKCPKCFVSVFCVQSGETEKESIDQLVTSLSRVQQCTDDFNDNATKVEFFNQHIKHLLLDDTKFKLQTDKIDKLSADVGELKSQLNLLLEERSTTKCSPKIDNLNNEISDLKDILNELVQKPLPEISPEFKKSIDIISALPVDEICRTEKNVNKLSEDVNKMADKLSSLHHNSEGSTPVICMQPNTTSPHFKQSSDVKTPIQNCAPFIKYSDNVVSSEMKSSIVNFLESKNEQFKTIGTDNSRDVLYFGDYSYRYPGGEHAANKIPAEIRSILEKIQNQSPHQPTAINSCLVSRYRNGENCIAPHRDDEPVINPVSNIFTVSIGAERTMRFTNNDGSEVISQKLKDGSLLTASRFSQDFWLHEIIKDESQDVRYSLTFREIAPHYVNSTVILGDSNTEHIKFGSGKGTLGVWMPGKRIKVPHIDAIPDATEIGPYRNVVVHTGVNSLNNPGHRKSNTLLIKTLETKLKNITTTYPKSKLYISLLLPSRSLPLNHRIKDFNSMILDLTCKFSGVYVIENSIFGNKLSNEHGRWKRESVNSETFIPNINDIVHLGKQGTRIFATNIKNSVVRRKKPLSRERFSGGGGDYLRAAERGTSHQRGGHSGNRFAPLADHHGD